MSIKNKKSIIRRMVIALVLGFVLGGICILMKTSLGEDSSTWKFIHNSFFLDISKDKGFNGLGLFYIIGQLFMNALQLAIVPLVLTSLTLALCSLGNPKELGRIAIKTFITFICFYIVIAFIAATIALLVKGIGGFNVNLPNSNATDLVTMDAYNPLVMIVNSVPSNLFYALIYNNSILSVVFIAIVLGVLIIQYDKKSLVKPIIVELNELIQKYLNFVIDKFSPFAIFCMITRALAIYGVEYIKPTFVWMLTTIIVGLLLVSTIYPIGIFIVTRLNPIPFLKKIFKVALFAAATNSSAATLPINTKTCNEELGCNEDLSSFILPTGMTVNMNGTTAMHMVAITFIGTAAGVDITASTLVLAAFLSICMAIGTPAIPVAGTTMVYVVMMGLGLNTELCLIGYSLVLAMNYLPGMAVITLNVVGDAATNVIVNYKEGKLDIEQYNK